MARGTTADYGDFSGGPGKEVNFVFFAAEPVRLRVTTCLGGVGGVGNSGSTEIVADVSMIARH